MEFKTIEVTDKQLMDKYLLVNKYGICDFSFANIFIWKETYKTKFTIHKDFLILCSKSKEELAFLMPLGEGNLEEIINDLIEFSRSQNRKFKMVSLTPHMIEQLKIFMPESFKFANDELNGDYIYLSDNMINLKGSKFSSKRNHINKFMINYQTEYEYVDINESLIEDCIEMNKKWCLERQCDKTNNDYFAVMAALNNFEALELKGGAIIVNGEMVAFSLGQKNNNSTFNIIIEKGLSHIDGVYPVINKEFATRQCKDFEFINREEDLGIEGLRKAKLSYKPHLLLEKAQGEFN